MWSTYVFSFGWMSLKQRHDVEAALFDQTVQASPGPVDPLPYSPFVRHKDYTAFVALWCTVTVTDPDGRRHSLDVLADSTYDAAHRFVVEAKKERAVGLPKPTLATVFEVVAGGKVYHVAGVALQRWIIERRQKWRGPKAYMFCQRPGLE